MFYIDGEERPSLHGTGSEDYFCGAWSYGKPFSNPYFGCPLIEGGHAQNALWNVYRYHLEDPVPFRKSIKVTMEHGHANNRHDDFSSVAYWYQTEPHVPFASLPSPEKRLPSEATVFTEAWVEEVEEMKDAFHDNQVIEQSMLEFGNYWSHGKQLLFRAEGPAVYKAGLPIEPGDAGVHDIEIWYTSGPDYGQVELWLNGQKVCEWDGYNADGIVRRKWESTDPITLVRDGNTVELRVVGKNDASDGFHAGWDCFRLRERMAWWEVPLLRDETAKKDRNTHEVTPDTVTTATLIDEMIDLRRLARYPAPSYKTIQFSSYDRRSAVPGAKHWFANSDGFGGEPLPNFEAVLREPSPDAPGEYLICDVQGPGAIVRLWTAEVSGTLEVLLDDAETPLYDGPAEQFFRHPYGTFLGGTKLTEELLSGSLYQRDSAYAPIPFSKRCRIIWTGNHQETHFYAVQVRKYQVGTPVVTFTPAELKLAVDRIGRVTSVFADPDTKWPYASNRDAIPISTKVEPHSVARALRIDRGCAIERLTLKVEAGRPGPRPEEDRTPHPMRRAPLGAGPIANWRFLWYRTGPQPLPFRGIQCIA